MASKKRRNKRVKAALAKAKKAADLYLKAANAANEAILKAIGFR